MAVYLLIFAETIFPGGAEKLQKEENLMKTF